MAKIVLSFRGRSYALEESDARLLCDHLSREARLTRELADALKQLAGDQQTQIGPLLRESDEDFVFRAINDIRETGNEIPDKLKHLAMLLSGDEDEPETPSVG